MHSAPSVTYPVGRSRFQGWFIALTGLIGVLTGLLWHQYADLTGWRPWLFAGTLIFSCVCAFYAWYCSPQGELRWDGQGWRWTSKEVALSGSVTAHLDFQNLLLLSMHLTTGERIWLWPERVTDATRWNALRRAIFSGCSAAQARDENAETPLVQVNV